MALYLQFAQIKLVMSKVSFKIGTDPEVILLLNDLPFSAEGVVGGDKYEPRQLNGDVKVHEDNILVEYNTKPASNKIEFIREIVSSVYAIHHELLKEKGIKISKACFADFDDKYLQTMQAQTIGCTPEFDAATCEMIEPPTLETFTGRSAGGHIHVGYENENEFDSMMIIKMLDLHLGVPSLIVDTDVRRRQLYGKASSFRRSEGIKVEYRTLSNFWTFNTALISWVYDTVAKVVDDVAKGVVIDDDLYLKVREAINTNNVELAKELIESYKLIIPTVDGEDILEAIYSDDVFLSEFVNNIPGETISFETKEEESEFESREKRNDGVVIKGGPVLDVHEDTPGFEDKTSKGIRGGSNGKRFKPPSPYDSIREFGEAKSYTFKSSNRVEDANKHIYDAAPNEVTPDELDEFLDNIDNRPKKPSLKTLYHVETGLVEDESQDTSSNIETNNTSAEQVSAQVETMWGNDGSLEDSLKNIESLRKKVEKKIRGDFFETQP